MTRTIREEVPRFFFSGGKFSSYFRIFDYLFLKLMHRARSSLRHRLLRSSPMNPADQVVPNPLTHVLSAADDPSNLKAEGVQIDVQHLCYGVQVGNNAIIKNILHNVSFRLRPGSMCALMGPSGSGKR